MMRCLLDTASGMSRGVIWPVLRVSWVGFFHDPQGLLLLLHPIPAHLDHFHSANTLVAFPSLPSHSACLYPLYPFIHTSFLSSLRSTNIHQNIYNTPKSLVPPLTHTSTPTTHACSPTQHHHHQYHRMQPATQSPLTVGGPLPPPPALTPNTTTNSK